MVLRKFRKCFSWYLLATAFVTTTSCSATYPMGPTAERSVIMAVRLHYSTPRGYLPPGLWTNYVAFAIDGNGVYYDVTETATWQSSNSTVAEVTRAGSITARTPGEAKVFVTYQGFSDSATVSVIPFSPDFPYLDVDFSGGELVMGSTVQASAHVRNPSGRSDNVTSVASWTSSDPAVATVRAGLITPVTPGTVELTVTHGGLSGPFRFSVAPFRTRPPKP